MAMCIPAIASRPGDISDIAARLGAMDAYADSCTYEVLLASLSEPVTYTVGLESEPAVGDTLSPISWSLPTPSGLVEGFSSYFDGSHFRFRDKRLQEYHAATDSEPFAPGGDVRRGVQRQVQFADLLPQFIAEHFAEMAADSTYIFSVVIVLRLSTACVALQDTMASNIHTCLTTKPRDPSGWNLRTIPGR